ncbi:MAG: hypothetical protein AVDCRST_MAG40-941, partial [uncultured Gemmatimonadaceae bacterium]
EPGAGDARGVGRRRRVPRVRGWAAVPPDSRLLPQLGVPEGARRGGRDAGCRGGARGGRGDGARRRGAAGRDRDDRLALPVPRAADPQGVLLLPHGERVRGDLSAGGGGDHGLPLGALRRGGGAGLVRQRPPRAATRARHGGGHRRGHPL